MDGATGTLLRALAFAAERHSGQRRKDAAASPYINHPIALADVLANEGRVLDVVVLSAAMLHDVIEDTPTSADEIEARFGTRIATVVVEVSDDRSLDKATRKLRQIEHAPHLSPEAKLVKLADKICNLRDVASNQPVGWSSERKQEYFEWAKAVVDGVRGVHPELERIFDEVYKARPLSP